MNRHTAPGEFEVFTQVSPGSSLLLSRPATKVAGTLVGMPAHDVLLVAPCEDSPILLKGDSIRIDGIGKTHVVSATGVVTGIGTKPYGIVETRLLAVTAKLIRAHERAPTNVAVEIKRTRGEWAPALIKDISLGGVQLEAFSPLDQTETVQFRVGISGGVQELFGRVVKGKQDSPPPYLYGIKLEAMEATARLAWQSLVHAVLLGELA